MADYRIMKGLISMLKPLQNHKEICRNLAPIGWEYGGFDSPFYMFQKGNYKDGFTPMLLLEEDLTETNIALMVKHKLTRIEGFEYA